MAIASERAATAASPWLLVANLENRRARFFQEALARRGHPPAEEIAWLDLLDDFSAFERAARPGRIVRIDSPGENFAVWRALAAEGAAPAEELGLWPRIGRAEALALEEDRGRIRFGRQAHLGFREVLRRLERAGEAAGVRFMGHPGDIAVLFDKPACQERLEAAGVPVPESLGVAEGYDGLRASLAARGWRSAFLKPAHASSASGVVAYRTGPGGREMAVTSAEMARGPGGELRLYNSLKVRRYERHADIRALVDALAGERLTVQRWVPKAGLNGRAFDLRVLAMGGRARHFVVRSSAGPMTNLHLGNRRGDPEAFLRRIDPAVWEALQADCVRTREACAPRSLCAGIDAMLSTDWRRWFVLEANAFGDLLPNILHAGLDAWEAQIEAMEALPE
jgi:glutathione synthase/RimK-type ligase-like ATP-grasp enzyme